ncbi:MAG: hypothetical protein K9H49_19750 [Bacteroidales bacterium]|nr:hypothetical protein [Bacteroidales bacterium]MCF8392247.1 hypothetical protein [Bacteroidales bacterium]
MNEVIKCAECPLREKYDTKPKSFAGRFWRWHINFCPGWKKYMVSLEDYERKAVAETYGLKKYLA